MGFRWYLFLDTIWEMAIFGATWQWTRCGWRVAISTWSASSSAGSFSGVVVATGSATGCLLNGWWVARAFWPRVGIAWIVWVLLNVRFVGIRVIGSTAAMLAGPFGAQVQTWSRYGIRRNDWPRAIGPASSKSTFVNHFRSIDLVVISYRN